MAFDIQDAMTILPIHKIGLLCSDHLFHRIIVQDRGEPALGRSHVPAFAGGIISDLIFLDTSNSEVDAVRMREVQPGYGCGGIHGPVGQDNPALDECRDTFP